MTEREKKKIRRLREPHIWPSVVFMLLSMVLAFAAFGILSFRMMYMKATERIETATVRATGISRAFDKADGREEQIMEELIARGEEISGFFLYDAEGRLILHRGKRTFGEEELTLKVIKLYDDGEEEKPLVFYGDTEFSYNLLSEKGSLPISNFLNFDLLSSQNADLASNTTALEARYWLRTDFSDGGYAMAQTSAKLYVRDIVQSLMLGITGFITLMFPTLFLFISVVINARNQGHMTKLLYTNAVTYGNSYFYFEQNADRILHARRNVGKLFMIVDMTVMKYRSYCNYHGIHAGEELLETIDSDLNERMMHDEFCALAQKSSYAMFLRCKDREDGQKRVEQLVHMLSTKFSSLGILFHAGIYFAEGHHDQRQSAESFCEEGDPADFFNLAGTARASLTDENIPGTAVYNEKLMEEQLWAHKVEEKMEQALVNEEFCVYIQPKYHPVTEQLSGAEALVRWVNEEDGFIPPGKFIPIFERNGFITKLDDYMLSHVAKMQAQWLAEGKTIVPISVNVSRAHFANPELAEHICGLIDAYNVPHNMIEIELTESAFFDDRATMLNTVRKLRSLGFEISMDDFGAGYSSLNSLKDLPLDVLKLDADFFRGEDAKNRGEIVVSQAITLAKRLNMRIVAEGIEKKEQVDFLAAQGCDMIQGYYFAKPMPASEYAERLTVQAAPPAAEAAVMQ